MAPAQFLVTEECGRLTRWLRLMGYDAASAKGLPRAELYRTAYNDRRIVVTRNHQLGTSGFIRVVQLRSPHLEEQLRQLRDELVLSVEETALFTRCDVCNVEVEPIDSAQVKDRVPPYVYHTQRVFHHCPSCHRVYWAATHWQRARALFERLKS